LSGTGKREFAPVGKRNLAQNVINTSASAGEGGIGTVGLLCGAGLVAALVALSWAMGG
jgi:hypothetical protein